MSTNIVGCFKFFNFWSHPQVVNRGTAVFFGVVWLTWCLRLISDIPKKKVIQFWKFPKLSNVHVRVSLLSNSWAPVCPTCPHFFKFPHDFCRFGNVCSLSPAVCPTFYTCPSNLLSCPPHFCEHILFLKSVGTLNCFPPLTDLNNDLTLSSNTHTFSHSLALSLSHTQTRTLWAHTTRGSLCASTSLPTLPAAPIRMTWETNVCRWTKEWRWSTKVRKLFFIQSGTFLFFFFLHFFFLWLLLLRKLCCLN